MKTEKTTTFCQRKNTTASPGNSKKKTQEREERLPPLSGESGQGEGETRGSNTSDAIAGKGPGKGGRPTCPEQLALGEKAGHLALPPEKGEEPCQQSRDEGK